MLLRKEPATQCSSEEEACVWRDILSHAATGELIAALNYQVLAGLCDDPHERAEAFEHAEREMAHAAIFTAAGRKIGVNVVGDVEAPYWKRIRDAFLRRAHVGDLIGCLLIQEVMLESFAVASYSRIGEVAPGDLGSTFAVIAGEEGEHVEHAVGILRAERARDPLGFDARVHALHEEVMTVLAEMVAREDRHGHCGVCQTVCLKPELPRVGLSTSELRGVSLRRYLQTLDAIGLPGELTLRWVAQLPA